MLTESKELEADSQSAGAKIEVGARWRCGGSEERSVDLREERGAPPSAGVEKRPRPRSLLVLRKRPRSLLREERRPEGDLGRAPASMRAFLPAGPVARRSSRRPRGKECGRRFPAGIRALSCAEGVVLFSLSCASVNVLWLLGLRISECGLCGRR